MILQCIFGAAKNFAKYSAPQWLQGIQKKEAIEIKEKTSAVDPGRYLSSGRVLTHTYILKL